MLFFLPSNHFARQNLRRTERKKRWTHSINVKTRALPGTLFLFGTDGYGFQEPRVQMVRGYGFHMIAVENGRFWRNSVCCGPVYDSCSSLWFGYGPVYDDSRLSLRVSFGPVCTQHFFSFNIFLPELRHLPCLPL